MIGFHGLVKIIGPLIFEREDIEEHGLAAIDDALRVDCFFGFSFIENESAISKGDGCSGHEI